MKKEYTYEVGDVVTMKKPHPCGSKEWEILRVGAVSYTHLTLPTTSRV